MKKIFAVSDVHGFYTLMFEALKAKGFDETNSEHILLVGGDLFDRGPEAFKMFEFVKRLKEKDRLIYIKGNHETLLFDAIYELEAGFRIYHSHHYSNKTVDTIAQLVKNEDVAEKLLRKAALTESEVYLVKERLDPVLDFIAQNTINYYETKDYIFVHGWLPCLVSDYYYEPEFISLVGNWRDLEKDSSLWEQARWYNGGQAWKKKCTEPNKTIVCGHWHCSWGHSHLHRAFSEFPQRNSKDFPYAFYPFYDKGIIMIDGCTAHSKIVNVLVFEEVQEGVLKLLNQINPQNRKEIQEKNKENEC